MDILLEAAKWINRGIGVIPIRPRDKRPALGAWKKYQGQLPTYTELLSWFQHPRNLAVITGWQFLTVLDFDNLDVFFTWANEKYLQTYQVMTSRGMHVYVYLANQPQFKKLPGIDIKSTGGYVLAPPSVHPSGSEYRVFADYPIMQVERIEDVLPKSWFPERQAVKYHFLNRLVDYDPWAAASNPINGSGLVDDVLANVRIESFFDDLQPTGNGKYIQK